jgi:hypothetical protein
MKTYYNNPHFPQLQPGVIIAGHFHETETYVTRRPEGMKDWLIIYTIDGEGYFRTPMGEQRCGAGDISILKAGVPHQYVHARGKTGTLYGLISLISQKRLFCPLKKYSSQELTVNTSKNEYIVHSSVFYEIPESEQVYGMSFAKTLFAKFSCSWQNG